MKKEYVSLDSSGMYVVYIASPGTYINFKKIEKINTYSFHLTLCVYKILMSNSLYFICNKKEKFLTKFY
jgi:hypothetical protein